MLQTHQMAIFEGIQECQFTEFAGVLGAMPGFMPLTTPPARSPTQIKALNDVAISINWRHRGRALPKDDPAAVVFANAGGWRFLSFLSVVQQTVLEKAKYVQKYLVDGESPGELDVEVEAVRKATFCFEKMTWGSLETVEPEADMRARVNDRLAVFNRERPETRELMLRILDLVMAELVIGLNFRATVSRWVTKYRAARREGPQSMFQDDRETRRVAATILTGLLFQVCFSRGVHMLMGICGGETARGVTGLRELVLFNFRDCLRERLEFDKGGRAWRGDLWMEEGCLWAEGMGYDVGNML